VKEKPQKTHPVAHQQLPVFFPPHPSSSSSIADCWKINNKQTNKLERICNIPEIFVPGLLTHAF
jgi:hypothetical protein